MTKSRKFVIFVGEKGRFGATGFRGRGSGKAPLHAKSRDSGSVGHWLPEGRQLSIGITIGIHCSKPAFQEACSRDQDCRQR